MKFLGEVEIRCAQHEVEDRRCDVCSFVRDTTEELQLIKEHRQRVVQEITKRLTTREVVMVGLR